MLNPDPYPDRDLMNPDPQHCFLSYKNFTISAGLLLQNKVDNIYRQKIKYNLKQSQSDSIMQEFNYKFIVYKSDHDSKMCVGSRNDFLDRCRNIWCEKSTSLPFMQCVQWLVFNQFNKCSWKQHGNARRQIFFFFTSTAVTKYQVTTKPS
jgi:hypothetical protein